MAKSLRDLFLGVNYDIDNRELNKADGQVDGFKSNLKGVNSELGEMKTKSSGLSGSFKKMGLALGAIVGIHELGRGLSYAVTQAAALEEENAKFGTVFGAHADEALSWIEDYSDKVGRSALETQQFMSETQNLLVGFGASRDSAFEMSKQVQQLSVDLASFNNVQDDVALNNIQSALLGNHRAAKSLGIALTEATLDQEAANRGYDKAFAKLKPLEKAQLRYQVMVSQSQDAMGDAERTAGSYTNQMKRLKGSVSDIAAEAGMALIPTLRDSISYINENDEAIKNFVIGGAKSFATGVKGMVKIGGAFVDIAKASTPIVYGLTAAFAAQKLIMGGSALLGAYKALNSMQLVLGTSTKIGTAVQWAWVAATNAMGVSASAGTGVIATFNAVLAANPIGAIVVAVGALVGGLKLLSKHFKWAKVVWDHTFGLIWDAVTGVLGLFDGDDKTITVQGSGKVQGVGQNAKGTEYWGGGLTTINEKGPEIVDLPRGSKVTTANKSKQLFSKINKNNINRTVSKVSGNNINLNFKLPEGVDAKQVARIARQEVEGVFKEINIKQGLGVTG